MANITEIINNSVIPGEVASKITSGLDNAILILKAIGILILIYIIFVIIKWISEFIEKRRIKKIYHKVNEMDEKIDRIIARLDKRDKKK
jgi:hypothetical protein